MNKVVRFKPVQAETLFGLYRKKNREPSENMPSNFLPAALHRWVDNLPSGFLPSDGDELELISNTAMFGTQVKVLNTGGIMKIWLATILVASALTGCTMQTSIAGTQ
jgi:hypothetical protein